MLSDEQRELASAVRSLMSDLSGEARVRELVESGTAWDEPLWNQLVELGVVGLAVPEDCGGQGGGVADLAVAFEEAGRALACVPLLSSSMAMALLVSAGGAKDAATREPLQRWAAGTRAAVALAEDRGGWTDDGFGTRAEGGGESWTVTGTKRFVLDGQLAEEFAVTATGPDGGTVVLVVAAADATVHPVAALDLTRPLASVEFEAAPARLVAEGEPARTAVRDMLDVAAVYLAAEQVGGAARCLDMAVEYAKVREQFGAPIGSFQAIKHKCADMLVLVEGARSLVGAAATALDRGGSAVEVGQLASAAKAYCSEAYVRCAQENIQIHGGIGFTWEHQAHLYLRRAKSGEVLLGGPAAHRERVVALYEQTG